MLNDEHQTMLLTLVLIIRHCAAGDLATAEQTAMAAMDRLFLDPLQEDGLPGQPHQSFTTY